MRLSLSRTGAMHEPQLGHSPRLTSRSRRFEWVSVFRLAGREGFAPQTGSESGFQRAPRYQNLICTANETVDRPQSFWETGAFRIVCGFLNSELTWRCATVSDSCRLLIRWEKKVENYLAMLRHAVQGRRAKRELAGMQRQAPCQQPQRQASPYRRGV